MNKSKSEGPDLVPGSSDSWGASDWSQPTDQSLLLNFIGTGKCRECLPSMLILSQSLLAIETLEIPDYLFPEYKLFWSPHVFPPRQSTLPRMADLINSYKSKSLFLLRGHLWLSQAYLVVHCQMSPLYLAVISITALFIQRGAKISLQLLGWEIMQWLINNARKNCFAYWQL